MPCADQCPAPIDACANQRPAPINACANQCPPGPDKKKPGLDKPGGC